MNAPSRHVRSVSTLILLTWVYAMNPGCDRSDRSDAAWPSKAAATVGPNVLLISIDTLRPDHLGCYGYGKPTSPRIDRLAAEGVVFENHISSTSWTLPAHAAMFTSLVDSVHGCTDTDKKLSDSMVTLAERFSSAGYATAGFFAGPYLHPAFGLAQGFDHYQNCTSYAQALDSNPAATWAMDPKIMRSSHQDVTNPIVLNAVRSWLQNRTGGRFFMFVHLWDVHFDFIPPPPFDKKFDPDYTGSITGKNFFLDAAINASMPPRDKQHLMALYDGEIAWTDQHVGKIIDLLSAADLLDETIVAVTSDHGTEFFEHGGKGHRMTLFDEVIRIPLLLRYPAKLPAGRRVTHQTRMIDLGPTLLALADLPSADNIMGHSLTGLAQGSAPTFNNLAISGLFSVGRQMRSLRTLGWKFTDLQHLKKQYFIDLSNDPAENKPLLDFSRGPGLQMRDLYKQVLTELARRRVALPEADHSQIPQDVRDQLESLGYIENEPDP